MIDRASATRRGSERAREIVRTAQDIAVERGYTGFTVEDVAERVGISRRTLFNHVDSKESAVLGPLPEISPEHVVILRGESPASTDDLLSDTVAVAVAAMTATGVQPADWQRLHEVLLANPSLIPRLKERIESLGRELVDHLSARPTVDETLARLVFTVVAALLQTSVEDGVERPELGDFAERMAANLAALRRLTQVASD